MAQFPHCDPRVLHSPGDCLYCDQFPAAQEERIATGINFTGENEPGLKPCPADAARGLGRAHKWHGNAPKSKDTGDEMTDSVLHLDFSGKDPEYGILAAGETLLRIEQEAVNRGWKDLTATFPVRQMYGLMRLLFDGGVGIRVDMTNGGRRGLLVELLSQDVVLYPCRDDELIEVRSGDTVVATVDYSTRREKV